MKLYNGFNTYEPSFMTNMMFPVDMQVCKPAEEVAECACWYSCPEDGCQDCNADCSCPSK